MRERRYGAGSELPTAVEATLAEPEETPPAAEPEDAEGPQSEAEPVEAEPADEESGRDRGESRCRRAGSARR